MNDKAGCNPCAIFTAVWALLVVAPPMSSGRRKPTCISRATPYLVERRRDQAAEADIDLLLAGSGEDFRTAP